MAQRARAPTASGTAVTAAYDGTRTNDEVALEDRIDTGKGSRSWVSQWWQRREQVVPGGSNDGGSKPWPRRTLTEEIGAVRRCIEDGLDLALVDEAEEAGGAPGEVLADGEVGGHSDAAASGDGASGAREEKRATRGGDNVGG